MRIGVGLPAAVPGAPFDQLGEWAAEAERYRFSAVAALDRLVYDSIDPLVALTAAAARTTTVELVTTVLGVPFRQNPVLLATQLASVDLVSAGRFTAGLALGGWPEDYAASEVPLAGRGARFNAMLDTLRRVWAGELAGAAGPMQPHPRPGRMRPPSGRMRPPSSLMMPGPPLLLGAVSPAGFDRVARYADGWIAPFFGFQLLRDGTDAVGEAWQRAGRTGRPRVVTERYFCLGPGARRIAGEYLGHYYGAAYQEEALADALTTPQQVADEVERIRSTGCDDLLLFPCAGDRDQLDRLAGVLAAQVPEWRS